MPSIINVLLQILYFSNIIIGFFIVFFEKQNPSVTWAWLMVIALIPYVGFVIYLIIGFESRKHSVFIKKSKEDEHLLKDMEQTWRHFPADEAINRLEKKLSAADAVRLSDLVRLHYTLGAHGLTTNNSIQLFHEGNAKYESLLTDVRNASSYIHMQYYIVKNGELGQAVIAALSEKARAGIEVKLYIDGMGSMQLKRSFFQPLLDAGGDVVVFLAPILIRLNYHNHRKICVIDGKIGYIGGLNIGDEYIGKKKRFGFWRDTHIRITGSAVVDLEKRFICDWNFCSKNKITDYGKYLLTSADNSDGIPMQVVCSGPDTKWPSIHYGYNKLVAEAEKSIFIESPYFIPDDSLLESLRTAALSGIDVRVVIPANPDHVLVYWASLSYLGELLKAGVKCYQYNNGFIHSKIMMMDSLVTSVGSANMDFRSLKLNFEANTIIYDAEVTEAFESQFYKDLEQCEEITQAWYDKRSRIVMIKESVSRLLSPLL